MEIRLLNESQIKDIYNDYMKEDFPEDELKPLSALMKMYNEEMYFAYGLFEENRLMAYAMFVGKINTGAVLLDYLAVVKEARQGGYGSRFLSMLENELSENDCIILESENDADAKDEDDRDTRRKRICFYKKNGMCDMGVRSRLFGVDYIIFHKDLKQRNSAQSVYEALDDIYGYIFNPQYMDKYSIFNESTR